MTEQKRKGKMNGEKLLELAKEASKTPPHLFADVYDAVDHLHNEGWKLPKIMKWLKDVGCQHDGKKLQTHLRNRWSKWKKPAIIDKDAEVKAYCLRRFDEAI